MEKLKLRLKTAKQALQQLQKALKMSHNADTRDIVLLRFQFTTEAIWKVAQHFLREKEGLDVNSPKSAARFSLQTSLINENQAHQILEIIDARNLIVHTYNEELAEELYKKMGDYYVLLESWLLAVEHRMP